MKTIYMTSNTASPLIKYPCQNSNAAGTEQTYVLLLWKKTLYFLSAFCSSFFFSLCSSASQCFIICVWILSERARHSAQMSPGTDYCRYNCPQGKITGDICIRKHTLTCMYVNNRETLTILNQILCLLGVVLSPWWGFLLEERTGVGVGGPDRSTSRRVWKAWWFRLCSVRKRSIGFSNRRF